MTARQAARYWRWIRSARSLLIFSVASVVANVVIVLTGGAVRLTASGLGCPTWPRCTSGSLVRTSETGGHGIIEFTNRMLTFALVVIAVATLVAAIGQRRERLLAGIALAAIPAQAVLGGVSVLTHLNPWVVSAHLLLSMAILVVVVTLAWRVRPGGSIRRRSSHGPTSADPSLLLARTLLAVTAAVLVLGTVVTGAGPHAGAATENGKVHRNGLDPSAISHLHADAVMILIGLTIGMWLLLRATGAAVSSRRAAAVLLLAELAQGVVGYVQYFTHVPPELVELHIGGACLVWVAALLLALRVAAGVASDPASLAARAASGSEQLGDGVDHQPDQRPDDRAVDANELQVAPDLQLQPAAGLGRVPAGNRR